MRAAPGERTETKENRLAGINDRFPVTLKEKHDGAGAVVRVKERHAQAPPGLQLDGRGGLERDGLEEAFEMLVGLDPGLQDALCVIDTAGVSLEPQEQLPGRG